MQEKATAPIWHDRRKHFLRVSRATFRVTLALVTLISTAQNAVAGTKDGPPVRDMWGELGLVDMPNARMTDDGMLSFTFSAMENTQRYNFDFQVLPWFEAMFRYGHISGSGDFFDYHRNLGFKIRLVQEDDVLPDVSIGARDIIGTGRQGAEYLVATKTFGPLDVTAGIGWGRLSDNDIAYNPIAAVFPSFTTRAPPTSNGGIPAFGQVFHGHSIGAFGGIQWQTPIDGLDVLAEVSSDQYKEERRLGVMNARSPFNLEVSYAPLDDVRIGAGWLYGTTYGVTLTYTKNPTIFGTERKIGPSLPPPAIRGDAEQIRALSYLLGRNHAASDGPYVVVNEPAQTSAAEQSLMAEAQGVQSVEADGRTLMVSATYFENPREQCHSYARIAAASGFDTIALIGANDTSGNVAICDVKAIAGPRVIDASMQNADRTDVGAIIRGAVSGQHLSVDALSIGASEIWLYYRNEHYQFETEAAGRVARVLMKDAPANIEIFHLILVEHGVAIREIQIARTALERAAWANGQSGGEGDGIAVRLPPVDQPVLDTGLEGVEPRLTWAISPGLRESFFDPNTPLQVQIFAAASADVELFPGLDLKSEIDANIVNNFNTNQPSISVLPHVRTDIAEYIKHGLDGIGDLEIDYRRRLMPDVYSEIRVGYLEDMYAGVGGQLLWRPDGGRLAFGADLYQVWKRDFNRLFGVQDYNILTGHISIYYNSPWYGLNFNVHAGRYLAGDYGATLELTRKFDTGVEIGAFATFTNVPFSKFGEGSFDKGFIIRIPFEWSLPFYTQTTHTTILHSLARDGGQRLFNDDSLYEETRSASYGELSGSLDQVANP